MARQKFAPQHSIVGKGLYIPDSDSAWDLQRVRAEIKELRKGKGKKFEDLDTIIAMGEQDPAWNHPFCRYQRGATRYDLDAEGLRAYLDESKAPETWRLKRIDGDTRAIAVRAMHQGDNYKALRLAFASGVAGLENGDDALSQLLTAREKGDTVDGKKVEDQRIIEAAHAIAYTIVEEVGLAVLNYSSDLTEAEKKV